MKLSQKLDNLSMKGKVMSVSLLLCAFMFIIGAIGIIGTVSVSKKYKGMLETAVQRHNLVQSLSIDTHSFIARFNSLILYAVYYNDDDKVKENYEELQELLSSVSETSQSYKENAQNDKTLTEEARQKLLDGNSNFDSYLSSLNNDVQDLYEGCMNNDKELLEESVTDVSSIMAESSIIEGELLELASARVNTLTEENNRTTNILIVFALIVFIAALLIGIILSVVIANSISINIKNVANASKKIAQGDFNVDTRTNLTNEVGQLSNSFSLLTDNLKGIIGDMNDVFEEMNNGNTQARINESIYEGEYASIASHINTMLDNTVGDLRSISECVKVYASGKFDYECPRFPGNKSIIHESFDAMKANLSNVSDSMSQIINGMNEGNLDVNVDESEFEGGWKVLVSKLNAVVNTISEPIRVTRNALAKVSEGDFNINIKADKYNGEFREMLTIIDNTVNVLSGYIEEISSILQSMANQNLDVSIDHEYVGDFHSIKVALELIINNFNQLVKEIIVSSDQVAIGSQSIADSSTSLAQGASEQASAVEELTATIGTVAENTKKNTENVLKSNKLADDARQSAERIKTEMQDLLKAMEEINESSNNISNIIKAIDDIAFQTNILALNAAVEAARAGEHGKGFAVVAEEVRNLAARSQSSAKETAELITESLEKVEQGSSIVDRTAASINEITKQIEEISSISTEIATDSKAQTTSISEINVGINQIATVVSNNTATSEESAAASEELASQSAVFKETVSKFVLKA